MKRYYHSKFSDDHELINLTPLLDVLFVILILFILIAPLMNLDQINLTESSSKNLVSSSVNDSNCLNIFLHKNNFISVNNKNISRETLKIILTEIQKNNTSLLPRLFVDKDASFGIFTETKDLIEECGFLKLDLVIKHRE